MKLIIEEHLYDAALVRETLHGIDALENLSGKVSVNYVGYYYNPYVNDCVFILPKVLLEDKDGKELVFGKLEPENIIDLEKDNGLNERQRKFVYEFAVWIYRAIVVFRNDKDNDTSIVFHKHVTEAGRGEKRLSNTFLDILLALIEFNRKNRDFIFFIAKNIHSGYNKINWTKTISHNEALIQRGKPLYLNPVNRKKQINFDEELLVIFFSILNYINDTYGFSAEIDVNYPLITGNRFKMYLKGLGLKRLKQIKYKYFSDKSLQLWDLCNAFFEQARRIYVDTRQMDYLLVKNFNIVFEAIIDNLIGDRREEIPAGLKDQPDGKRVDHMYSYQGLTTHEEDKPVFYIGDSKYYKRGNPVGKESVYKQFTYARNVIQWNLNLFMDSDEDDEDLKKDKEKFVKSRKITKLRDDVTEGYNIIPNFFISATMNKELDYNDTIRLTEKKNKEFESSQFKNRLFDRDTLLVCHYDVNFLYVVSLYARNNAIQKGAWKKKVRAIFREAVQDMLKERYDFYAMEAFPQVNAKLWIKEHFQDVLGKIYTPFSDEKVFSLALDKKDPEKNNADLLKELRRYFYVESCELGNAPHPVIAKAEAGEGSAPTGVPGVAGDEKVLIALVDTSKPAYEDFLENKGRLYYSGTKFPSNWNLMEYKYLIPYFKGLKEPCFRGYYPITGLRVAQPKDVFTYGEGEEPSQGIRFFFELGEFVAFRKKVKSILPTGNNYSFKNTTFDELAVIENDNIYSNSTKKHD